MIKTEHGILKRWKTILGILTAIVIPAVTATSAFYDLKEDVNTKINAVQLDTQRNFVQKETLKEIRSDIKDIRRDVSEIKTLIIRKSK